MNTKYDIVFAKDKLLEIAKEMQKSRFKPGYDNMTGQSGGKMSSKIIAKNKKNI